MAEARAWALETGPTPPGSCSVLGTMASAQPDTRSVTSLKHMPGPLAPSEDGQTTLHKAFRVLGTNHFAFYPLSEGPRSLRGRNAALSRCGDFFPAAKWRNEPF